MAYSARVIREGIKQQMRTGRPPDFDAIKHKMEMDERHCLSADWQRDEKGRCLAVSLRTMYNRELVIYKYHNVTERQAIYIKQKLPQMEQQLATPLRYLRKNPNDRFLLQRLQQEWERADGLSHGR